MIDDEIATTGLKIKVVERAGLRVKKMLQTNDPFREKLCSSDGCMVCGTTGEGNCRKNGVVYQKQCKGDCGGDLYHGETHTNGYTRGLQHQSDYQYKREGSVMWKHCVRKGAGTTI